MNIIKISRKHILVDQMSHFRRRQALLWQQLKKRKWCTGRFVSPADTLPMMMMEFPLRFQNVQYKAFTSSPKLFDFMLLKISTKLYEFR